MESLVLIIGFACFGGLLAGYSVARLFPRWMLWTLWGVCVLSAVVAAGLPGLHDGENSLAGAIIVFGAILPFTGCAFVAGLIGLVARRSLEFAS